MTSTWIESAAKGRNGGPVRAGVWAAVVIGTHPVEDGQSVLLEISANDVPFGPLPAYWIEQKGVNSHWHVPIPPQPVGTRLRYRSSVQSVGAERVHSPYQDTIVRPNLPDRHETPEVVGLWPEGLVGNRRMTVRVDARGSTQDVYFPTVGLTANVRPAEGDLPQSRSHFRAIVGGLAMGASLAWFNERAAWDVFQHYQGATNLLRTELTSRLGDVRVLVTDFAAMGTTLPRTAGGEEAGGQYLKRFRIVNGGSTPIDTIFGVYVHAEVNGGQGEPGLRWQDSDRALLATNRGHGHVNRKLARDATVEFSIALDDAAEVHCEPTGPNEAVLLRHVHLPANGSVRVDLCVSGAYTGWRGDAGTFQYQLRPALEWFRSVDLDLVEQAAAQEWDAFVEPLPNLNFPRPGYAVSLRRSALAAAIHTDAKHGAIASGYDRGLSAYCRPREALTVGHTFHRVGHPELGREVYRWLAAAKGQNQSYSYWYEKYTIDGVPEWETPAVDQTAMIPWGVERIHRQSANRDWVASVWPLVERAAGVCLGSGGHPGLCWLDDLSLMRSAGLWDSRFGAFLYSNAAVVAGLRSAARLAILVDKPGQAQTWIERADRIWNEGVLRVSERGGVGPGLVDGRTGRFLEARRLVRVPGLWTEDPARHIEQSAALDISILSVAVPFGLLPASDPRVRRSADAILGSNTLAGSASLLARRTNEANRGGGDASRVEIGPRDVSSLASLWMAQYLLALGRETGEGRSWTAALSILDSLMSRLGSLGLAVRSSARAVDAFDHDPGTAAGVWGLHGMLIDVLLDFAGLGYDAVDRRLSLRPCLPAAWPSIGISQRFDCGEVSYKLIREVGARAHRLELKTDLTRPVTLDADIVCPGLDTLGPWSEDGNGGRHRFDPACGRVSWSAELPAGTTTREWSWG